jgi:hypothetical protein
VSTRCSRCGGQWSVKHEQNHQNCDAAIRTKLWFDVAKDTGLPIESLAGLSEAKLALVRKKFGGPAGTSSGAGSPSTKPPTPQGWRRSSLSGLPPWPP